MAPQLTLQAPLELPPQAVSDYLGRLWNGAEQDSTSSGAATFSLLVWQPSWIEQQPWQLPVYPYEASTWGPAASDSLLARDGLLWRRP